MNVILPHLQRFGTPLGAAMLTVIIHTLNSERALVRTLAALVPGATSGLVAEVLCADAGSRDETAAVADVAGCNFLQSEGPLGLRLKSAAAAARAPWLLFLRPGIVLDAPWVAEVRSFVERSPQASGAAVFRRSAAAQTGLRQAVSLVATSLGALPRPEQGLMIGSEFYRQVGGHSLTAADPEPDLLRRIGRRRITTLSTGAFHAR
ncbi:MAG: glycosyltransferase [Hyphomicrobiales bacterium]|nr:glycosyltransferase [Hyphomicrobiales bacterium]MDE2285614.1 glycosyltransferase [Hyphomicrobiales bacterium]